MHYADGIDVSWIWDGNHEAFADMDIPKVIAGGDRHEDMALRLKVAGIPEEKLPEIADLEQVISEIKTLPTDHVYILATYTRCFAIKKIINSPRVYSRGMNGV